MNTKLKDVIFNSCNKFLIKDLINIVYLYAHTVEIKIYITDIKDCKFPDDDLPDFCKIFFIMSIYNIFNKSIYDFKFLIYEDLYIDCILRVRKIYWHSQEIKNIARYDQNGEIYESFIFKYTGELEYELYFRKYKNDNYIRIIAHGDHNNYYYGYANLKNNIQDGIFEDIYGSNFYKNGKKIEGKYINFPKIFKIWYEDTKRDKLFRFSLKNKN